MTENHQNKSMSKDSIRLRIFLPTLTSLLLGTQFGCKTVDTNKFLYKNNLKRHIPSVPLSLKRTRVEAKLFDTVELPKNGGGNGGADGSGGSSGSPTFTSSSSTASPNLTTALPQEPLVGADLQVPLQHNEIKVDSKTNAEDDNDDNKDTANDKQAFKLCPTVEMRKDDALTTVKAGEQVKVLEQVKRYESRDENKSNTQGGSANPSTLPKELPLKGNLDGNSKLRKYIFKSGRPIDQLPIERTIFDRSQVIEKIREGVRLKKTATVEKQGCRNDLRYALMDRVPKRDEEDTEPKPNESGPERSDSEWDS